MPATFGDPVDIGMGATFYESSSFDIQGSQLKLEWLNQYSSSAATWSSSCGGHMPGDERCLLPDGGSSSTYLPRPFGRYGDDNVAWWHGLYSFVREHDQDGYLVQPTDGRPPTSFDLCDSDAGFCYAAPKAENAGAGARLLYLRADGGLPERFVYSDGAGQRFTYSASWVNSTGFPHSRRFFLTRIEGEAYDAGYVSLHYAVPLDGGCYNGGSSSVAGTPYLSSVTTEDGVQVLVEYKQLVAGPGAHSLSNGECVISRLLLADWLTDGGQVATPLVSYSYTLLSDGGEQAGRLASVTWKHPSDSALDRTETYFYSDGGAQVFDVWEGALRTHHGYSSVGLVSLDSSDHESLTFDYSGDAGAYCSVPGVKRMHALVDSAAGAGDGATTSTPHFKRVSIVDGSATGIGAYNGLLVTAEEDALADGGSSPAISSGTVNYAWTCSTSAANPTYESGMQDKRGNWSTAVRDAGSIGAIATGVYPLAELTSATTGATASDGTDALETRSFSYAYGGAGQAERMYEQLVETETEDSVYAPSSDKAVTKYTYDGRTNRVKAIIRSGYTAEYSSGSWSKVQKYRGTFYFTDQPCSSGGEDSLGRVLEVHGPCWVSSDSATDCASGTSIPVTQYTYYSAGASSHRANRMATVTKYADATTSSCSGGLTTSYDEYDYQGHVTQSTDPNGVVTTSTYALGKMTSSTVAGATTSYGYEKGKLIWVQHPEGNYDVYCYRSGTSGECTGGSWTTQLQWQAKAGDSTASSYSERIDYQYWPDGTVKSETSSLGSGEVRRIRTYAVDAHRRPTWSGWGRSDSGGPPPEAYHAVKSFDGADNVSGVGLPYNDPPAFCGGGVFDKRCAKMVSDRSNRLSEVDEYPTSSSNDVRTCIGHDDQGNTTKIIAGLGPSDTCLDGYGKLASGLPSTMAQTYAFDDFGNMVEAALPWTGSSGGGTTHYQYNALGDETKKQSPAMGSTYTESLYDQLGRLTQKKTHAVGTTTLYTLQYDSGQPHASCPQTSNTAGRLVKRTDSFGATWYSYDAWGRVAQEIRLRQGVSTCSSPSNDNPHTSYAYSSNGNLTRITYPHGRVVTYSYGADGLKDRVAAVNTTTFLSDGGTADAGIIAAVAWEPYGGLRGYQINHPTTGTSAVEYMLGDYASNAPDAGTECPSSPPATGSGSELSARLRALRISTGSFSPGTSSGDIYKRTYTWIGDQVARTDTCVLDGGARTETFSYDQLLRLTSASASGSAGGSYSSRGYAYDGRSNRLADGGMTEDGMGWQLQYGSSALGDQLRRATSADSQIVAAYTFDDDGRVTEKDVGQYIDGGVVQEMAFIYGPDSLVSTDTVFKAASVNGASYNYYFDAFGRRRLKMYPLGTSDEYFHDVNNQLLSDRGMDSMESVSYYVEDDYVWLDGRPVALVRGRFDTSFNREADTSTDCTRNSDSAACGVYFPITDHIGKPVLMLDRSAHVAGVGEYDPFGRLNQRVLYAGTAHPYGNNISASVISDFTQAPGAAMSLAMRVELVVQELEQKGLSTDDHAWVEDGDTGSTLEGPFLGTPGGGKAWTSWLTPSAGRLKVKFSSDSTNCCAGGSDCGISCSCKPNCSYAGISVARYEYRRYQSTSQWFWTPLRFLGQYYDPETDFFENWNRYYDPASGGYLQPEPVLARSPSHGLPAYAYGKQNPLHFTDKTGFNPYPDGCDPQVESDVCTPPKGCNETDIKVPQSEEISMSTPIAKRLCRKKTGRTMDPNYVVYGLAVNNWLITCYYCSIGNSCSPDSPPHGPRP